MRVPIKIVSEREDRGQHEHVHGSEKNHIPQPKAKEIQKRALAHSTQHASPHSNEKHSRDLPRILRPSAGNGWNQYFENELLEAGAQLSSTRVRLPRTPRTTSGSRPPPRHRATTCPRPLITGAVLL